MNEITNVTNQNAHYNYTYSADKADEAKRIMEKYVDKGEDKLEQLKALDASATKTAMISSMSIGIIATLIMGAGMSIVMTDAGPTALGVIIGIIGLLAALTAYPTYKKLEANKRAELAPEILRLSKEIMGEDN